jgi:hypothetical protein
MTVVDANANVGPALYSDFEFEPTLDALDARLTEADVDEAVVAPLKPPSFDFDAANERLAERLADRDEYYGIGRIDPRVGDAAQHARRALEEYGLYGLKLHPWEETFSITDPIVEPVLDVAAERDVPVWIYGGYPNVSRALSVRRVVTAYPEVDFVLTHTCQLDISGGSVGSVMLLARETDNTYFELSGTYRHDVVQNLVAAVGPERVLFGSNAPAYDPRLEKARVTMADVPEAAKRSMLGDAVLDLLE